MCQPQIVIDPDEELRIVCRLLFYNIPGLSKFIFLYARYFRCAICIERLITFDFMRSDVSGIT